MQIKSQTLKSFIEDFEKSFGLHLKPSKKLKNTISTKHLDIYPGMHKFSDWDLKCYIKDKTAMDVLESIISFIKSYNNFDCVGNFVTDSDRFTEPGQSINQPKTIQMMGFMIGEKHAPFFDFSISDIKRSHNRRLFKQAYNNDFLAWSLLTAWRKIKNKDFMGRINSFLWIMCIFVLPQFKDKKERKRLLKDPEQFFLGKLKGAKYKRAVDFLKNPQDL